MINNQLNNPGSQSKDSNFIAEPVNLNPYFDNLINPDTLSSHLRDLKETHFQVSQSIFNGLSANEWMLYAKTQPTPKMLFDEFWYEFEICILFADTNAGKSILAVQIGDSISKGIPISGFKLETEKQPVHYFDFELSAKQFELRYSVRNEKTLQLENPYEFAPTFIRIVLSTNLEIPKGIPYEQYICESLERYILDNRAKILIIDNVTYLSSETEKGKDAQILMKHLKHLKEKYKLSILVLAHTPKRDPHKPLTKNDLQGSRMMMNFADSAFAIGKSCIDPDLKYLKQVKVRNTSFKYEYNNVPTFRILEIKSLLQFEHIGFSDELDHLKHPQHSEDSDRASLINDVKTLSLEGLSQRQIAEQLNIALGTVNKYLKS